MYGIEVVNPPATPIAAAELRARLRLNDSAEDSILAELLAGAVDLFESDTNRPVLATTYRQHLSRWPFGPAGWGDPTRPMTSSGWEPAIAGVLRPGVIPGQIVLGRGSVTAIAGVYRRLADGSAEAVPSWSADLFTPPARITLAAVPALVLTAAGVPVSPVGYVEFTAGWSSPATVPALVRTAIMLLAAHWYKNREAHREGTLSELPDGWCRVVNRYRLGITGDWGQ